MRGNGGRGQVVLRDERGTSKPAKKASLEIGMLPITSCE